jgi:hypothetical protein
MGETACRRGTIHGGGFVQRSVQTAAAAVTPMGIDESHDGRAMPAFRGPPLHESAYATASGCRSCTRA